MALDGVVESRHVSPEDAVGTDATELEVILKCGDPFEKGGGEVLTGVWSIRWCNEGAQLKISGIANRKIGVCEGFFRHVAG